MARMIVKFSFLFCFLVVIPFNCGVDMDYFERVLRMEKEFCITKVDALNCQRKCAQIAGTGLCIERQCYCVFVNKTLENGVQDEISVRFKKYAQEYRIDDDNSPTFAYRHQDNNEERDKQLKPQADMSDDPEYLDESLLIDNSNALRHHIAHFCPNLDVARTCIRTCMVEGKPAFCGKDHVCYCGHRYTSNDKDPQVNVSSVYGQFKDLYAKYFGPNYRPDLEV